MAHLLVFGGCSSSSPATGGTGGSGSGTGGSTGSGTGGSTTNAAPPYATVCPSGVKNKGTCTTEPQCVNTCGPLKSGYKNCDCAAGAWACPVCSFLPANDYSCYHLPSPVPACPQNPANAPTMLPKSGDPCTLPVCQVCGSGTSNAYLDSTSTPKVGYCVCSASDGTGTFSCASTSEWPPQ